MPNDKVNKSPNGLFLCDNLVKLKHLNIREAIIIKNIFKIILGNILITAAYAFITVPHQIINGGVTAFSMIVNKFIPINISFITNFFTITLLLLCFFYLGKEFLLNSLLSSICYMVFFSSFSLFNLSLPVPQVLAVLIASLMVGVGYFFCLSANSSAVGFDVIALILHKKNPKLNIALTMRYINFGVILLGLFSYGILAIIFGLIFTFLQTEVIKILLAKTAN